MGHHLGSCCPGCPPARCQRLASGCAVWAGRRAPQAPLRETRSASGSAGTGSLRSRTTTVLRACRARLARPRATAPEASRRHRAGGHPGAAGAQVMAHTQTETHPHKRPPMSAEQRVKLSVAQRAYVAHDPRWPEHRRKLAAAQEAKRMTLFDNELATIVALRRKGPDLLLHRRGDRGLPRRDRARAAGARDRHQPRQGRPPGAPRSGFLAVLRRLMTHRVAGLTTLRPAARSRIRPGRGQATSELGVLSANLEGNPVLGEQSSPPRSLRISAGRSITATLNTGWHTRTRRSGRREERSGPSRSAISMRSNGRTYRRLNRISARRPITATLNAGWQTRSRRSGRREERSGLSRSAIPMRSNGRTYRRLNQISAVRSITATLNAGWADPDERFGRREERSGPSRSAISMRSNGRTYIRPNRRTVMPSRLCSRGGRAVAPVKLTNGFRFDSSEIRTVDSLTTRRSGRSMIQASDSTNSWAFELTGRRRCQF